METFNVFRRVQSQCRASHAFRQSNLLITARSSGTFFSFSIKRRFIYSGIGGNVYLTARRPFTFISPVSLNIAR